jgi:hypothetical protein
MSKPATELAAAAAVAERCSVQRGSGSGGSDTQQSNGPRQNAAACSWAAASVEAAVAFSVAAAAVGERCSVQRGSGSGGSGTQQSNGPRQNAAACSWAATAVEAAVAFAVAEAAVAAMAAAHNI